MPELFIKFKLVRNANMGIFAHEDWLPFDARGRRWVLWVSVL
jgi:hypothetical protein